MSNTTDFKIYWYNKLQVRIQATLLTMFLFILLAITVIANTIGDNLIERRAQLELTHAIHVVISALQQQTAQAVTLANSIAQVSSKLPADNAHYDELIPKLIELQGLKNLIPSGGVFFEPFEGPANKQRDSFFWSSDEQGSLQLLDNYNLPGDTGYHQAEWYVPAKYLHPGEIYWSRAYVEPYTLQSMITASAPIYRQNRFIGVATIDVRLDGLQRILAEAIDELGGYAFAVDRNNRLLSSSNKELAKSVQSIADGGSQAQLPDFAELAEKVTDFKPFMRLLDQQSASFPQPELSKEGLLKRDRLANALAAESDQIEPSEATFIASSLLKPATTVSQFGTNVRHALLAHDHFSRGTVFVTVSTMVETDWQIVTVMPKSVAQHGVAPQFSLLYGAMIIAILFAALLISFLLKRKLTRPIAKLTRQLKNNIVNNAQSSSPIKTTDKGEIGALTHWFNLRNQQLYDSQLQATQLAFYDPLTGLPNRRMLLDRLEQQLAETKRRGTSGAVLFLDLDYFKEINDARGHSVGDELLKQVGQRFAECLREQDVLARIGGDEFVITLVSENTNQNESALQAATVAHRIIDSLSSSFNLTEGRYHITASIGISLFPQDQQSIEDLLKQADTAMYQVKSHGRNDYYFFEAAMQHEIDERLRIKAELRHAIDANELRLHYQPQIDASGHCRSVEALVRWQHPLNGLISPAVFLPVAEESNLIVPLGRWVLFEACRQTNHWNEQGIILQHVAVNVSALQFQQDDFINEVKAAMEEFHIRPQQLMLEITEGVIIENTQDMIEKMRALKALGISISMDDFGTGYSSLSYLKQLPIDQLKIDQSFVRDLITDPDDVVIVKTIIAMARHLGYDVIAEGVETQEQQQLLCAKGCFNYQGYYFSRPLTAAELSHYLDRINVIDASSYQSTSG